MSYRISGTKEFDRLKKEIEDNFLSLDKDGNLVFDGNISCNDGIFASNSIYLGNMKISEAGTDEGNYVLQANSARTLAKWVAVPAPPDHASSHESGGADTIDHDSLTGFVANEHLPAIDEDDMVSDSATNVPTQQSVKAYVDSQSGSPTITRVTTTYTMLSSDRIIFANTDGGAYVVTLIAGVANKKVRIVNTGSSVNNLTITPNGSEHLIGVNSSFVLSDGESLELSYNTTDGWY